MQVQTALYMGRVMLCVIRDDRLRCLASTRFAKTRFLIM
jgi:hypothetical protein